MSLKICKTNFSTYLLLQGFKGNDGKLDYDKLFESLNNQSFRRRWIKSATLYLADWASYLANPDVYLRWVSAGPPSSSEASVLTNRSGAM